MDCVSGPLKSLESSVLKASVINMNSLRLALFTASGICVQCEAQTREDDGVCVCECVCMTRYTARVKTQNLIIFITNEQKRSDLTITSSGV